MVSVTETTVFSALQNIQFPLLEQSYCALDAVESVEVNDDGVKVTVCLGMHTHSQNPIFALALTAQLEEMGVANVQLRIKNNVFPSPSLLRNGQLKDVKNIVMVASGKGGVGKSTTAVNLALALQAEGAKVGILDADIYGPSMSTMLGIAEGTKPQLVDEKFIEPIKKFGLKSMSVAYMSAQKTPMIWRGPMAVKALQQFLEMTLWGALDYLIIDMPPGTGDIHISLAQKVNVSAAVVVTTPQEMALTDARKGIEMFNKVHIPVLGIIENMATHVCSNCGFEESIFGSGGAQSLAQQYQVSLLGSLPLNKQVREHVDAGIPTVVKAPASALAQAYLSLANQVGAQLWHTNLQSVAIPEIQMVD